MSCYKGGLKSSYDDVISVLDNFLTNEIQALQYLAAKINFFWSYYQQGLEN